MLPLMQRRMRSLPTPVVVIVRSSAFRMTLIPTGLDCRLHPFQSHWHTRHDRSQRIEGGCLIFDERRAFVK